MQAPTISPSKKSEPALVRRKILFLDHTAALSGGELALYELVQRLNSDRFQPLVVLCSDGQLREKLEQVGVETLVIPLASEIVQTRKDSLVGGSLLRLKAFGQTFAYARRLSRFLREQQIDIVHTNSLKADIIGGFAARMARVPVIWHVRDRIDADYLPAPAVRVFRWLCRTLPDFVVANSQATLETILLPPNKPSDVVYSGVVLDKKSAPMPLDESETPTIGIVGRLSSWKGQHIFIRAAERVHARFPQVRFQIIGSAMFGEEAYEQEIRELVVSLDLSDCLEFLGYRKDVAELLRRMTVLVHASTSGEPFGQVVVQGMEAGRPVVATNGGGVPEIVEHEVTGLLVPMGDVEATASAIMHLLACPEVARQMGVAGRKRVEDYFTIETTVQKVESIYERLGNKKS